MKAYIEENKERFLEELLQLLRIPSVSTDTKLIFRTFSFAGIRNKISRLGFQYKRFLPI